MKDDKTNNLTEQDLSTAHGDAAIKATGESQYRIGDQLMLRNNSNCFGHVIDKKYQEGQWVYKIMGSGKKPIDAVERDLVKK